MCAGAALQARVGTIVYGAPNPLLGADGSWVQLLPGRGWNPAQATGHPGPNGKPASPLRPHAFNPKMQVGAIANSCPRTRAPQCQLASC